MRLRVSRLGFWAVTGPFVVTASRIDSSRPWKPHHSRRTPKLEHQRLGCCFSSQRDTSYDSCTCTRISTAVACQKKNQTAVESCSKELLRGLFKHLKTRTRIPAARIP